MAADNCKRMARQPKVNNQLLWIGQWSVYYLSLLLSVQVTVAQLDDNYLQYNLIEEQVSNSLVGNIVTEADLDLRYTPEVLTRFRFRFVMPNELFVIEERSGLLRTSQTVDRDTVCSRYQADCSIEFDIAVQPAAYFQIIKVKINILDINDNTPTFPEENIVLSISETTTPGATFALPVAEDADSGVFGTQTYQLLPRSGSSKFALRIHNNTGGEPDVHLELMQRLDREVESSYTLVLMAQDGGIPKRSGSLTIDITVMDANDNRPRFTNQTYEVSVYENVAVNTVIARVRADDPDEGANGQVSYAFSRSTQATLGEYFGIDSNTGEIYVRNALDYEHAGEYVLSVVGKDRGPNPLSAYAKVAVHVWDVNDHAPHITVSAITGLDRLVVSETAPVNTFVALATVQDPDSGQNGMFTCTMDSNNFRLQPMNENQFQIRTDVTFDREAIDSYRVELTCVDMGAQPKTTTEVVFIHIGDENDHSPRFGAHVYTAVLRENNNLDAVVAQVNASDEDIGDNGQIRFSIMNLGNFPDSLIINPKTGVVRPNRVFDYEEQIEYEYLIIGADLGSPSRSASATLHLTLQDMNDNPPSFNRSYEFGTFENQRAGTEIGTVLAYDADGPRFNVVSYALDTAGVDAHVFTIEPLSGRISTREVLDRETKPSYKLSVIARNIGYSLSSSVDVTVIIADKNDNAPMFLYPLDNNETVVISGAAKVGDVISQVEAMDRDSGVNALLRYDIVAGNSDQLFDVNPLDGTIVVNKDLGVFGDRFVKIGLLVSDQGSPSMSAVTDLNFYIDSSGDGGSRKIGVLDEMVVVKIVACIFSLVVFIGIVVFITMLVLRRRRHKRSQAKYNCRVEASRVLMNAPQSTLIVPAGHSKAPTSSGSSGTSSPDTGGTRSPSQSRGGVGFNPDVIQDHSYLGNGSWQGQLGNSDMQQDPRVHTHTTFNKPAPKLPPRDPLPNDVAYPDHINPPPYSSAVSPDVAFTTVPARFNDEHRYRLLYQGDIRNQDPQPHGDSVRSSPSLSEVRLQAGDLFDLLPCHSASQGDRLSDRESLTDSGRGGSEEGDHHQHSPNTVTSSSPASRASPSGRRPRCVAMNQPTKFRVYPRSPRTKQQINISSSSPSPASLPPIARSHPPSTSTHDVTNTTDDTHPSRKLRRGPGSAGPVRDPCSTFKKPSDRPPRQPMDGPGPSSRVARRLAARKPSPAQCASIHGSSQSLPGVARRELELMDAMSDDGTTTSGSYTVDMDDVNERLQTLENAYGGLHMSSNHIVV